jgi:methylisocitrate lyase
MAANVVTVSPAANALRELLARPGIVVLPGAYDALSARLIERAGFEVVFTTGFGIAAATLGVPDIGLLTATETLDRVRHISGATRLPLVADCDTGYGNPLNVIRTVGECAAMGVAGIILEDQEWPKKCGHFEGKRVVEAEEHVQKLRAAVEARGDSGLVLIARTDARAPLGLDEAIRRGHLYREAGADVIFIEAPRSVDELRAIASAFDDIPLFANMIEGGVTPFLAKDELETLGYKLVVYPLSGLFAATRAIAEAYRELRERGTTGGATERMVNLREFQEVVDLARFQDMERQFHTSRDPV